MANIEASSLTMKTSLSRRTWVQTFCYWFDLSCVMFYKKYNLTASVSPVLTKIAVIQGFFFQIPLRIHLLDYK